MPTSSITERFILDEKGCDRLLEIIEKSKTQPAKKFHASHRYEEGKELLEQCFSGSIPSGRDFTEGWSASLR